MRKILLIVLMPFILLGCEEESIEYTTISDAMVGYWVNSNMDEDPVRIIISKVDARNGIMYTDILIEHPVESELIILNAVKADFTVLNNRMQLSMVQVGHELDLNTGEVYDTTEWYFPGEKTPPNRVLEEWAHQYFGRYGGYAQQYLFHGRRLEK